MQCVAGFSNVGKPGEFRPPLGFVISTVSPYPIPPVSTVTYLEDLKDFHRQRVVGTSAYVNQYRITLNNSAGAGASIALSSLTPSICSITLGNEVRFAGTYGTGLVKSVAVYPDGRLLEQVNSLDFTLQASAPTQQITFLNWLSASISTAACTEIDSRLAGKSPATALAVYSTIDHVTPTYTRNSNCWAADVDLTCVPVWDSQYGQDFNGALITTQAILCAAHAHPGVGATVRFVANDNTVVTRTIVGALTHPSYTPYYPDITILSLNSAVPSSITPAKLLPSTWGNQFATLANNNGIPPFGYTGIPALCFNQRMQALVADWRGFSSGSIYFGEPIDSIRDSFYLPKVGGDSGSPAFVIINGTAVLLTVWTYGGAGQGTFDASQETAIQTMLTTLSAGTFSTIDLSGYPSY